MLSLKILSKLEQKSHLWERTQSGRIHGYHDVMAVTGVRINPNPRKRPNPPNALYVLQMGPSSIEKGCQIYKRKRFYINYTIICMFVWKLPHWSPVRSHYTLSTRWPTQWVHRSLHTGRARLLLIWNKRTHTHTHATSATQENNSSQFTSTSVTSSIRVVQLQRQKNHRLYSSRVCVCVCVCSRWAWRPRILSQKRLQPLLAKQPTLTALLWNRQVQAESDCWTHQTAK